MLYNYTEAPISFSKYQSGSKYNLQEFILTVHLQKLITSLNKYIRVYEYVLGIYEYNRQHLCHEIRSLCTTVVNFEIFTFNVQYKAKK